MTLALYKQLERDGMQVHIGPRRQRMPVLTTNTTPPAPRGAAPRPSGRAALCQYNITIYKQIQALNHRPAAETESMLNKSTPITIAMLGLLTVAGALVTPAVAQRPNLSGPNLAGKNVTMIIGFGPGGGYDAWGRVVA